MFIDADGDGKTYVELQVNPKGATFDSYLPTYRQNQNDWDSGMKVGVNVDGTLDKRDDEDKGWTVEMAIPLEAARGKEKEMKNVPPKVGTEWRVNFFRMDQPNGRPQSGTGWSPPMVGDFHALDKFGVLVFGDDKGHAPNAAAPPAKTAKRRPRRRRDRRASGRREEGRAGQEGAGRAGEAGRERPGAPRPRRPPTRPPRRPAVAADCDRPRWTSSSTSCFIPRAGPTSASELRPSTRIYLALFVLGVTAAGGVRRRRDQLALGALAAPARTTSERNERTIARLRRDFILLVVAIGAYLAVEMAPLPARLAGWLAGRRLRRSARWSARGSSSAWSRSCSPRR